MSEKRKKASIGEYRLNFDYSNSTIKRIKSLTWIVLAAGGIAAFADLFLLINLAVKYTNLATFPIILFILDIAFIAASAISNYRFKYSAHIWRAYVFLSLLFSLIMTIGPYWNSAQRYMTGTAFALIIISRIVSLAILVVAINIAKKKITKNTLNLAIGLLAVIFVVGIGYTAYNGAVGFHGQNIGITAEDMTIVYEYDSSEGYYIASGVLEGEGNQITVPLTFDGSPVGAIDCSIFKETEAQKVSILGDSKLSLLNLENLESINSGITFEVHKDLIDDYRYEILNSFSSISVSLANAMVPHSLEEDEVYITFAYSETNYIYGKPIVPTWIGETGSSFSLEYLADREGFLPYSNYNLESDLAWNYANNNNKVLRLYKPSGETLTEENVTRSINKAQIDFEKIFNVRMLTGNDNKYNIPSSWASVGSYNGRYMIESQFQEIYNDLPSRNGFSVSWAFVSSTGSSTYSQIQSVDVFSSFMKSSAGSLFQIKPTWTVKAPSISKVSSGRTNNSFTYGENISISTLATSQGLPIKYKLKKSGLTVAESTNGSFLLQTYLPSQSGVYTVEAWSENSSLSSLKSQVVTKSINLVVNKKSLQFAWTLPDGDSYDGNSKTLTCFLDDQLVGSDILDFSYTFFDTGVIDAGDYTSEITLSSSSAEKYSVKSGYETANFTILPMTIEATWGSNIFTYNGEPQKPSATATGIPEDGALEVIISGEMINVGEYVSSASLTNTNYVLSNPTSQFIINRREITVVWEDVAFIYNGISQHPFVAEINNEVEGEEYSIINSLSYKDYDQNINKGEGYTVESTLPSESNYVFNVSQIGTYTIGKRPINVIWQTEDSFVYNGEEQRRSVSAFDDIVPGEETATLGLLVYPSGYKDVGTDYSFGVTIQEECNYIFLDIQTTTFSITPKEVSITADSLQKTYNGNAYEYTFTYSVSGLEGLDTELDLGTITPSNNAVDAINAGEYTISQIISLENRGAEYDNYTIYYVDATLTIYPKELTITTLTTSNNGVKIYDGQTYTDLDYDNSTLAPTDILSDILTLTYTGEGVTAINYRSTPYTVTASLDSEGTKYSNYQIEYIPADITIEKREITVGKISSPVLTKEYDGNLSTSYDFSYNTDYELIGADIGAEITGATKGTSYDQKGVGATKIIVTFGSLIGGTGYIASNYDFVGGQYLEYEASITPKSLDIVAEDKEKTYDGTPYSGFTVSAEGLVAGDSISDVVTISYFGDGTTAVNHSETQYTVTPGIQDQGSLYSNYNISFYSGGVTINQRPLTLSADNKSKTYDGFTFSEFSVSPSGLASTDNLAQIGTVSYLGNATTAVNYSATPYTITPYISVNGDKYGNYNISFANGTLTISKKALTITAIGGTKTYDGIAFTGFSYSNSDLASGDTMSDVGTVSYSGTGTTAVNYSASAYTVTPGIETGNKGIKYDNYNISFINGGVTINKKALTITAIGGTKTYDGAAFTGFNYSNSDLASGDTMSDVGTVSYSGTGTTAVNYSANTYPVTPSIGSQGIKYNNYNISFVSGTVTINKKDVTVTAENKSKTYDGQVFTAFTATASGLAGTDTISQLGTVSYSGTATTAVNYSASPYTITPSISSQGTKYGNYNISFANGNLTINKRDVTVTAENKSKTYDGQVFTAFTATASGLAGTDTISQLGTVSYSGTATTAVNYSASPYTITPSISVQGTKYGNYNISFANGNLTINKRDVTVTAENKSKTYDGQVFTAFTATASGLAGTDTISQLGTVSYSGTATTAVNYSASPYTITPSISSQGTKYGNYNISFANGNLTISKKALTITAVGGTKTYDGTVFTEFDYTNTALASGDTMSDVGTVSYSGTGTTAVNYSASTYPVIPAIGPQGAKYGNYNISFVNGSVRINKKAEVFEWTGSSFEYTGSAIEPTVVLSGKSYETGVTVTGYEYYQGTTKLSSAPTQVGSYKVKVLYTSNNYTFTGYEQNYSIIEA